MHNDCYIYRLDEQRRVLLSENMSEFLKMPAYFSLYTYFDDHIEHIYGDNSGPYRVEWAYLESGTVKEILCFVKEHQYFSISTLEYEQSVLTGIHYLREAKGGQPFDLKFLYDANEVLQTIHRIWPKGQKDTIYSTAKVNFKSLGQRLLAETEQAVSAFLQEHNNEHLSRFALDCYTGHGYVSLCMDTDPEETYKDSPADWAYEDFKSLPLIEFPLDDNQTEKLRKTVIQMAGELLKVECFQKLTANAGFQILVFDHNELIWEKP